MQYLNRIEDYSGECRTAITLGKFDGFHRGHQKLLYTEKLFTDELQVSYDNEHLSNGEKIESIVFAFDMLAFRKEQKLPFEQIMLKEERVAYLEHSVDYLIECPFNEEIRHIGAMDFITEILVKKLRAKYLVVGSDFHFGFKAQGDVHLLRAYSQQYDYEVIEIEKEMFGEKEISSSYIREELMRGNVEDVNQMLGYAYTVTGTVIQGRQLGRTLGFPTMNVAPSLDKLLPLHGVYVVDVLIQGEVFHGIANVGKRPTVSKEQKVLVEVNVFDYEGDAYEETIRVSFLKLLRCEKKFNSVGELKQQVDQDIVQAQGFLLD